MAELPVSLTDDKSSMHVSGKEMSAFLLNIAGQSDKETAEQMSLSAFTVRNYVTNTKKAISQYVPDINNYRKMQLMMMPYALKAVLEHLKKGTKEVLVKYMEANGIWLKKLVIEQDIYGIPLKELLDVVRNELPKTGPLAKVWEEVEPALEMNQAEYEVLEDEIGEQECNKSSNIDEQKPCQDAPVRSEIRNKYVVEGSTRDAKRPPIPPESKDHLSVSKNIRSQSSNMDKPTHDRYGPDGICETEGLHATPISENIKSVSPNVDKGVDDDKLGKPVTERVVHSGLVPDIPVGTGTAEVIGDTDNPESELIPESPELPSDDKIFMSTGPGFGEIKDLPDVPCSTPPINWIFGCRLDTIEPYELDKVLRTGWTIGVVLSKQRRRGRRARKNLRNPVNKGR